MAGGVIRIGTRGSQLALAQCELVRQSLQSTHPDIEFRLEVIRTEGDRDRSTPLSQIGGTGLFTKQIEQALRDNQIDLAVHSAKDLPSEMPPDLTIAAVPRRGPIEDALVFAEDNTLESLRRGACVGTGSPRRQALLLRSRPDLKIEPIRGNLDTRLKKVGSGNYDAIVVARAGLERNRLSPAHMQFLDPSQFVPAGGQGALVLQARTDDAGTVGVARVVDHQPSRICLEVERAVLAALGAGCHAAVGVWARYRKETMLLKVVVLSEDGQRQVTAEKEMADSADLTDQASLLAEQMLSEGAAQLISG